jgi:hypothetical protein
LNSSSCIRAPAIMHDRSDVSITVSKPRFTAPAANAVLHYALDAGLIPLGTVLVGALATWLWIPPKVSGETWLLLSEAPEAYEAKFLATTSRPCASPA